MKNEMYVPFGKTVEETCAEHMDNLEIKGNVARWKSNGNVPFADVLEALCEHGFISAEVVKASIEAREADLDKFAEAYREARRNYKPSEEELFEMRAAFGPGATVVDVISGQKFKL